jgi:hypothetical protein
MEGRIEGGNGSVIKGVTAVITRGREGGRELPREDAKYVPSQ